jgi:hypothetical protein
MATDTQTDIVTKTITKSNNAAVEDTYAGPRHGGEYSRLREQHAMIKALMKGKLVLAPVDLSNPQLTVLDSATADGYWLQDLSNIVASTAKLVGADIAPQYFLSEMERASNMSFITHNMFDVWPKTCQGTFDLVHQRFVLPVCSDKTSLQVIRNLQECAKQGGWLMLHDADFDTIEEGSEHRAMEQFRDVLRKSWTLIGYNLSPGPKLRGWFEEVGLDQINDHVLHIKVGAAAESPDLGRMAINVLLSALEGIELNIGSEYQYHNISHAVILTFLGMPGYFFSAGDFASLKKDLREELELVGNSYQTHIVWGQKQ